MAMDKYLVQLLKKYSAVFKDARERGANESDTVMYITKMFEDVFKYDPLKGEISKEYAIKDKYCDIALKIEGELELLVECKAASIRGLTEKHIEQAENYASRNGTSWVLLTNGIEWQLFHVTFSESDGIAHDLAFSANLVDEIEKNTQDLWSKLALISRESIEQGILDEFWTHKKSLKPGAVLKAIFSSDAVATIRRELNRTSPVRLDAEDVFDAIKNVVTKDALLELGEVKFKKKRKRKKKESGTTIISSEQSTSLPKPTQTSDQNKIANEAVPNPEAELRKAS